jgi:hypothetical protein
MPGAFAPRELPAGKLTTCSVVGAEPAVTSAQDSKVVNVQRLYLGLLATPRAVPGPTPVPGRYFEIARFTSRHRILLRLAQIVDCPYCTLPIAAVADCDLAGLTSAVARHRPA